MAGAITVLVLNININIAKFSYSPRPRTTTVSETTSHTRTPHVPHTPRFAKYFQWAKVAVVYGGTPITKDKEMFKGADAPHVLIGTPGRVLALIKDKIADTKQVKQVLWVTASFDLFHRGAGGRRSPRKDVLNLMMSS